jgi:hypothetical protein
MTFLQIRLTSIKGAVLPETYRRPKRPGKRQAAADF